MPAMALLDRDGVYGAPRFHMEGMRVGIRPHIGSEITVVGGHRYPLLVATRQGYRNLCRLTTRIKMRARKGEGAATLEELAEHAAGLLCPDRRRTRAAGGHTPRRRHTCRQAVLETTHRNIRSSERVCRTATPFRPRRRSPQSNGNRTRTRASPSNPCHQRRPPHDAPRGSGRVHVYPPPSNAGNSRTSPDSKHRTPSEDTERDVASFSGTFPEPSPKPPSCPHVSSSR